jgi:cytochrome oxidase assembly protein ShyY1
MTRRLPLIPTIIVALAVATMIGLGFWQIGRAREKEAVIAGCAAAGNLPPISYPTGPVAADRLPLFRHATGMCLQPAGRRVAPGQNRGGEPGFVHIVECRTGAEGTGMNVQLGWSKNPNAPINWPGGLVSGIIAPDRDGGMRLVAASAPPGLEQSAEPSVGSIPNSHRSYAVQWFLFAGLALLIYLLAVRQRAKAKA